MNRLRGLVACAVLSVMAIDPREARAGGDDRREIDAAQKSFDLGMDRLHSGDLNGARILLAQSYVAWPGIETLRNLALVELRSDHFLEALGHFRMYATDHAADPAFLKDKLPKYLEICNQRVGHLKITVPAGADVALDGHRVQDVREPVDVLPGAHLVAEGSETRAVTVAAGETADVRFESPPTSSPATAPTDPGDLTFQTSMSAGGASQASQSIQPSATWWTAPHSTAVVLGGLAVAAVVTGVAFYVNASDQSNEASIDRTGLPASGCTSPSPSVCANLRNTIDTGNRNGAIAGASFVVAGIAAAGSLGFILFASHRPSASAATASWAASITPGMLNLGGSF